MIEIAIGNEKTNFDNINHLSFIQNVFAETLKKKLTNIFLIIYHLNTSVSTIY